MIMSLRIKSAPSEDIEKRAILADLTVFAFDSLQRNSILHCIKNSSPMSESARVEGVEFVLAMKPGDDGKNEARGLENPERMAGWARKTMGRIQALGDVLHAGYPAQAECLGPQRHVALGICGETQFCVGWRNSMNGDQVRDMMKKVLNLWAS